MATGRVSVLPRKKKITSSEWAREGAKRKRLKRKALTPLLKPVTSLKSRTFIFSTPLALHYFTLYTNRDREEATP